ncbi:MAG: DUF2461 domain-containing protein, partial [Spirochaetes bacterium]|nr:DUF2461 domain-containing protein [Spirochaetota bacterium]
MAFSGFYEESLFFLNQLAVNNDKAWFEEHKSDYEKWIVQPSRDFIVDMGKKIQEFCPMIHAEPKVNRSMFKIYRDTRFSQDKTPFKTHFALWFWEGERPRMENSGFYFHVDLDNILVGAGIYQFSKELLEKYREVVAVPDRAKELTEIIDQCKKEYRIVQKHYKRVPRGFDADYPYADLLLYNGITAFKESEVPDEFYSSDLVDYCVNHFKKMNSLHR